jgi:hypothetical protein
MGQLEKWSEQIEETRNEFQRYNLNLIDMIRNKKTTKDDIAMMSQPIFLKIEKLHDILAFIVDNYEDAKLILNNHASIINTMSPNTSKRKE